MPTLLGSLRRLALTPSLRDVTFNRRGFPVKATSRTERLEVIPQSVICGFEWAIEARGLWEVERRLLMVEPELRGYAYEGATMAYTIRDAIHGKRTRELLLGPAQPHLFLSYIGVGFALSRLPRRLWRKVVPDLTGSRYYPRVTWLAVDGYGFDRAYFHTDRWVSAQKVPHAYPWAGSGDYFLRAVDQGIGRALWFIHGAGVAAVTDAVLRFPEHRRADLWSGVGLAATFAGGCESEDFSALRRLSGEHWAEVGLGTVLAVKARVHAGFVPKHTEPASALLAGMSVPEAVALADRAEESGGRAEAGLSYEGWRRRIAGRIPQAEADRR
ncbi:DUF1702 family protein [Streptomyces sedi]|uniref:DUF1702 family protein n=1 Tax=Streptomyces sedi TaxID=555059 RepID=A0A5C4VEI1_9ACTN|nr:DUF1702 family protein [Streptomyces sedi]TNM34337.1 DUF1702 family protein [Streptomyces sedi]